MKRLFSTLATVTVISLSSAVLFAQENSVIELAIDKKILYTDRLNLPGSTDLLDVLMYFPELNARPGLVLLDQYDIQLEGVSLGNARETVLSQLRLQDVEKIELTQSPESSFQTNAIAGTLKIKLRPVNKDGVSGNVALEASYPVDVLPGVQIDYKKDNFQLRTLGTFQYYGPRNMNRCEQYTLSGVSPSEDGRYCNNMWTNSDDFTESVRIIGEYSPYKGGKLTFKVGESFGRTNNYNTMRRSIKDTDYPYSYDNTVDKKLNVHANIKYEHVFENKSKVLAEANYFYKPSDSYEDYTFDPYVVGRMSTWSYTLNRMAHSPSAKLEYKYPFKLENPKFKVELTAGTIVRWDGGKDDKKSSLLETSENSSISSGTTSVKPYFNVNATLGIVSLKAELDYYYYGFHLWDKSDQETVLNQHNLTGRLLFGINLTESQRLRFTVGRRVINPSTNQLFPFVYRDPYNYNYYKGNSDLLPVKANEVSFDYVTDVKRDEHHFYLNFGVSYVLNKDVIRTVTGGEVPGLPSEKYLTYINSGTNKVLGVRFLTQYSWRWLSLTLSANTFSNNKEVTSGSDQYTYYNIMLVPAFHFPENWNFSMPFHFNSPVNMDDQRLSNCIYTILRLGKSFKTCDVYAFGTIPLSGRSMDIKYVSTGNRYLYYNMIYAGGGLGFRYNF